MTSSAVVTKMLLLRRICGVLAVLAVTTWDTVSGVDMQGVFLKGGTEEYLEVSRDTKYELQCMYRAGYDDDVTRVQWRKYDNIVYTWNKGSPQPSVQEPLSGNVDRFPANNPHNIHFTKITHNLAGNYSCVVTSTEGVKHSSPFSIKVVDIAPVEFETHVNLVNEEGEEISTEDSSKNDVCTLSWDFKSPAIYPRPNITCGYYSYDYDDVTTYLPAGLSMEQHLNGSWQAGFDHTKVDIKDIPVHGRLGCSIKIPKTSYKKLIKFDNDFIIDSKIDETGCPAPSFSSSQKLQYQVKGATMSCRGELVPTTRDSSVKIMLKCPPHHIAVFKNGSSIVAWEMVAGCASHELVWRQSESLYQDDFGKQGAVVSFEELPYCMMNYSGAGVTWKSNYWITVGVSVLVSIKLGYL